MAKRQAIPLCNSCEAPLRSESPFCPHCGRPTVWASHDERVSWEVGQWRATRSRGSESNTVMMLVRTEAGYEPAAVDRRSGFVWDQPLHPEREVPARQNPHATRPSPGPITTNGNAKPPAAPHEPTLEAALRDAVDAPAPSVPAEIPAATPAPVPAATPAPERRATEVARNSASVAGGGPVTISKKAVAVGILLALGLPLSGTVSNITGSAPESSHGSLAAPAAAAARPVALKAMRSGFNQVSPDAARFAVVVQNPNRGYVARSVTVAISFFDASGHRVGADIERVAAVPAGARIAVAGQTGVSGLVARLSVGLSASFEGGLRLRPFIVRDVHMTRTGRDLIVRATVSAPTPTHDARVVVVDLDRSGRVVGGDFVYVDVPRSPRSQNVVVSTTGVPGVARVEVFVVATY